MLFSKSVSAQLSHQSYTYEFFNTSHGLPSSQVNAIAKDNKGYLWVGSTVGLSKFDGYTFNNYSYTLENDWIGNVQIIKADAKNNLWIGSTTGLFYYSNDTIIKLTQSLNAQQAINNILIEENYVWLAGKIGLAKVSIHDLDFTGNKKINIVQYLSKEWQVTNCNGNNKVLTHIAKADDNTLYAAQFSKLFRFTNNKWELIFDKENQRDLILSLHPVNKDQVFFDCAQTEMNEWNKGVSSILYNNSKTISPAIGKGFWYIGTSGLYCFHPESKNSSQYINTLNEDIYEPNAFFKEDDFFLGSF